MRQFEPQDTGEPQCNDPTHDHLCDCGATPDADFEAQRVAEHE